MHASLKSAIKCCVWIKLLINRFRKGFILHQICISRIALPEDCGPCFHKRCSIIYCPSHGECAISHSATWVNICFVRQPKSNPSLAQSCAYSLALPIDSRPWLQRSILYRPFLNEFRSLLVALSVLLWHWHSCSTLANINRILPLKTCHRKEHQRINY